MKWSLGFSSVGCVWVFYLPCIYPFPPWVWICHTFLVFARNIYIFLIFFFPLLVVLLPFGLLCPLSLSCFLPNSLLIISLSQNSVSSTSRSVSWKHHFLYCKLLIVCSWTCPAPHTFPMLCSSRAFSMPFPCPLLFSQDVSCPWSPQLLPSFINNEWFFSGLF